MDKLGTGLPAEELGHIIFTSVRQDLLNEENVYILLRILWLKANIFLCQGDVDVVIETLELVRSFLVEILYTAIIKKSRRIINYTYVHFQLLSHLQVIESKKPNACIILANCKNNSQINTKLVRRKLTSIQRFLI